jgi:hypothetical protein
MTYRGRLIWPFIARIERLDTSATKANTLGQSSGYDRVFREPVRNEAGADARVYRTVELECQVSTEQGPYERQAQFPAGRELEFDVRLVVHYADLEQNGFIDLAGNTALQPSDRLREIVRKTGERVRRFEDPLFCVHAQDRSFGLSGLHRNLVLLYFRDRREGAT